MTDLTHTGQKTRNSGNFDKGAAKLREHLKTMPSNPGVYRMLNEEGSLLYVGKAKNLAKRIASYTHRARLPLRLQRMVASISLVEITITDTEAEALLLEANLIRKNLPPYNILLRDDKSYPYVFINRDHDFPQIQKFRGKKTRKGWYFGPFASATAVNETILILQKGFLIRNCSDSVFKGRNRPCLQYHIKRCTAPCVGRVSQSEYARQVEDAREFLRGKSQEIQKRLSYAMQKASLGLDYEKAALYRDRIQMLSQIQSRQDINVVGLNDSDIFFLHQKDGQTAIQAFFFRDDRNYGTRAYFPTHAKDEKPRAILSAFLAQFYADKEPPPTILVNLLPEVKEILEDALSQKRSGRVKISAPKQGDKKRILEHAQRNAEMALSRRVVSHEENAKLLEKLTERLQLADIPKRIEVYDNSHLQGTHAIGAMIVAGPEGFIKKAYRKFTIRTHEGKGDDYAMMEEVFKRRFQRLLDEKTYPHGEEYPDLVLIDGGAGQLSIAQRIFEELGIEGPMLMGIAKGPDRHAGRERFFCLEREPMTLAEDDPVLFYLQRLRDEAHRFAIGFHRSKRERAIHQNELDEVPGIGAVRKKALLHYFGSAKAVKAAAFEDLCRVEGISRALAKKLHDYFNEAR